MSLLLLLNGDSGAAAAAAGGVFPRRRARARRRGGLVDPRCPLDWSHPTNRGLLAEYAAVPNPGWRGGLTLRDLVRGGRAPHDGTLVNGPKWQGAAGRPGGYGSLSFDGTNDLVNCGDVPGISGTALTVAGWLRRDAAQANFPVPVHKETGGGGFILYLDASSGTINFRVNGSGTATTSAGLAVGAWYHCCATYDGVNQRVYLNGLPDGVHANTAPVGANSQALCLGNDAAGVGTYFQGALDGVLLWPRCLSAAEVRAFFDESRRGNPSRWRWLSRAAWSVPAAAGGAFSRSFSGAVTPSATLARQPGKALADALATSGALARLAGKLLAGALAPGGALARRPGKGLAGAAAPAGTLARQPAKGLAGAAAPSGQLARLAARALAGAVAAAGGLARLAVKALAGAVSPTGLLTAGGRAAYYFRRYILGRRG
jgi:hypothetical protein